MPTYDNFVFDEIRRIGKAWIDKNPGYYGNEFLFEKIGEMSWRRLVDQKSMRTILEEIGVNPADYGEIEIPVINPPINIEILKKQPRYALSVASLIVNNKHNIQETVKRLVDAGANSTRINLLSALWNNEYGKINCMPFRQTSDGRWNLVDWNPEYFDRLAETKESMNSNGINIQWTNRELYSFSDRKEGVQQINTPWRNNVNGIFWPSDDTSLIKVLPSSWCKQEWFPKICPLLDLHINPWEIGNELPEKELHERDRAEIIKHVPSALIQVNRNDDKPGQYANMMRKGYYHFLAIHGNKLNNIEALNEKYSTEPEYKTYTDFINRCPHDKWRVIFSSDGARISDDKTNTYDYVKLGDFFDHMTDLGYGIDHQSRAKMTAPPNHDMIEVDWFLKRVKK